MWSLSVSVSLSPSLSLSLSLSLCLSLSRSLNTLSIKVKSLMVKIWWILNNFLVRNLSRNELFAEIYRQDGTFGEKDSWLCVPPEIIRKHLVFWMFSRGIENCYFYKKLHLARKYLKLAPFLQRLGNIKSWEMFQYFPFIFWI